MLMSVLLSVWVSARVGQCVKKNPTHTASRIVKRFEQVNLPGKAL